MTRTPALLGWLLLGMFAILGSAHPALAAPPRALALCVARVATGDTPAAIASAAGRFDCTGDQYRLGRGDFWVRASRIDVREGDALHRVRFNSQWQERVTLYAGYADGRVLAFPLDRRTMSRRLRIGGVIEQALPIRAAALTSLLWRVDGSGNFRRILGGAELVSDEQSDRAEIVSAALYAAFAGLGIGLIAYNATLWVALRRRFLLAYCLMVASLVGYVTASSGAIVLAVPDLDNNLRIAIAYLLLPVSMATALWFARTILSPQRLARWLEGAIGATIGALLGSAALFAAFMDAGRGFIDQLIGAAFVAVLLLTPALLWQAWRRSPAFLLVFVGTWLAPVMLAAMRVANTFRLLTFSFSVKDAMLLIVTVEAVLSSLAVAYLLHLFGRERDEAREQEVAARLLADTDPLTGLLNRRAFLAQAVGRPGEQTLMLADLDHFKQVNDTIGHDGGDEVLRIVARALRIATPEGGLIARLGGEEFAVLIAREHAPAANVILQALRTQRMPFDLPVTASVGVCSGLLMRESDWTQLYAAADRALFAAKAAGRDRVSRAPELRAA